jgi:hypothetical protein
MSVMSETVSVLAVLSPPRTDRARFQISGTGTVFSKYLFPMLILIPTSGPLLSAPGDGNSGSFTASV